MACSICGKPRNILASIFGGHDHPACVNTRIEKLKAEEAARKAVERAEAAAQELKARQESAARHQAVMEHIARGEFKPLNEISEMLLDDGETLCLLIKGCWSTFFYARAAGRITPGQAVRFDGLKKVDFGTLHVTDRRICFIGKGGGKSFQLKRLLQCETRGDTLHIVLDGRASSAYFIIESPDALEVTHAGILKLAEKVKHMAAASNPTKRRKAFYVWRSRMDENTCPECRERHLQEWEHKREANPPPYPWCSNENGCRCELVKLYEDEPYPEWAYPKA